MTTSEASTVIPVESTTETSTESSIERAARAITLADTLSTAQCAALRTAFKDDQGIHHLGTVATNTRRALERKNLVHSGLDTLTDLGRIVHTVLVDGADIVRENAEREDAGPHAIVINKQRHGQLVSVRFASPDRLDDVLFEMGVPPRYRASVRVPHDRRGTYQVRERRYTWAPAAAEPAPVTPPAPGRQQPQRHHVADDGARQVAKVIRTLTPPMRGAITAIADDPIAPGVDGRTLEALLNRDLIRELPGHYFPRFALTDRGRLVHETLTKRATRDDTNEDKEPEQRDAEHAGGAPATGIDDAAGGARGHVADHAALRVGGAAVTFAPVAQGARWQVLVTQELSRLYRVTVDHDDLGIDHDPHDTTALAEAVRARALELFTHGSARAIGGEQSVEIASWEVKGSRRAVEALEFHTQRVRSHAERTGTGNALPLVLDTWSSASRQHYIDTGRYLPAGDAGRDDGDGLGALLSPDELDCALRTFAELHGLGATEDNREHLSSRQRTIAERVYTLIANSDS